jgi:negative regulator of sigma E activity
MSTDKMLDLYYSFCWLADRVERLAFLYKCKMHICKSVNNYNCPFIKLNNQGIKCKRNKHKLHYETQSSGQPIRWKRESVRLTNIG